MLSRTTCISRTPGKVDKRKQKSYENFLFLAVNEKLKQSYLSLALLLRQTLARLKDPRLF